MTENIHDEPTQKDFLENVRDEPILPRSKTAFDVHSEKLSFDMREALLRFMHEHGLSKQDAGRGTPRPGRSSPSGFLRTPASSTRCCPRSIPSRPSTR